MSLPVDVVSVVSKRIKLEEDGENFIGTCPTCEEVTLIVSPVRQIFYCFSCHKGGNAETFEKVYPPSALLLAIRQETDKRAEFRRRAFRLA